MSEKIRGDFFLTHTVHVSNRNTYAITSGYRSDGWRENTVTVTVFKSTVIPRTRNRILT